MSFLNKLFRFVIWGFILSLIFNSLILGYAAFISIPHNTGMSAIEFYKYLGTHVKEMPQEEFNQLMNKTLLIPLLLSFISNILVFIITCIITFRPNKKSINILQEKVKTNNKESNFWKALDIILLILNIFSPNKYICPKCNSSLENTFCPYCSQYIDTM